MSVITGFGVHDSNARLRLLVLVFFGVLAFGSVLYWREKTLLAAEYVDPPQHKSSFARYNLGDN